MQDSLELYDIDDAGADGLAAGELASIGQDWQVVTQMLPAQWQAMATELRAVRRQLRGFGSVDPIFLSYPGCDAIRPRLGWGWWASIRSTM